MATLKGRINITVSPEIKQALTKLAERDRVPTATKAADLLREALEIHEDVVWNKIAEKRDKKNARYISHEKAWR